MSKAKRAKAEAKQPQTEEAPRLYYVTVRDAGRYGFLLGPYATHEEALASVDRGRELACEADGYASFYAYGTSSLPAEVAQPKTAFGK